MPTPLGHALAGLGIAGLTAAGARPRPAHVGVLIFCATAPDLDLVLRLVDGVNHHRGPSHSLAAAVCAGLVGYALKRWGTDLPGAVAIGLAWGSHVLLDYLGLDTSPPSGEMALWPFSSEFYASPVSLFYDVRRAFTGEAVVHNFVAAAIEVAVLGPMVFLCWRHSSRRGGTP